MTNAVTPPSHTDTVKNIVLVNLWRVINARGGAEKVFFDMANNLSSRGYNVTCLGYDPQKGTPAFFVDPKVRFINCFPHNKIEHLFKTLIRMRVCLIPNRATRKKKRAELLSLRKYRFIKSAIDNARPDVIVTFQPEATWVLSDMIKSEIPVVTMFHSSPNQIFETTENTPWIDDATHRCACVQVLRPEYVEPTRNHLRINRVVYIPNIVRQIQEHAELDAKKIINVARLTRWQKQQHILVEAFALLKDEFPDWKVELWGETHVEPPYTEYILNLIDKLGLNGRVTLCGPTDDVQGKLLDSSIFAFPSFVEGFPLALTEAMSAGLPSVGFYGCAAVDGLIVNGSNGLLCNPTPQDLANVLRELMLDKALRQRLGRQAKVDMRPYVPEKIWDQWEMLLNEIAQKQHMAVRPR